MLITILLIVMYAKSTIYILSNSKNRFKVKYVIVVCLLSLAATLKDKPQFDFNECEISALNEIRNSPDSVVLLSQDCTVLSWNKQVWADDSKLNADLLKFWNITDREKLYYQK
ncbi:MAG: hypothetical protein IPP51_14375 [Bacteroidetes bacterium]|nr:hypothetical protein [Bacteroidota bacterium]